MKKKIILFSTLILLMFNSVFSANTLNMYRDCDGSIYETELKVYDYKGDVRNLFLVDGKEYISFSSKFQDAFDKHANKYLYTPTFGDTMKTSCSMDYLGSVTYFKKGIDY